MHTTRSWARSVLGASGAALLAPVAILVAAATIGFGGGGFSGLSALRQAVAGPEPLPGSLAGVARAPTVVPGVRKRAAARRAARASRPSAGARRRIARAGGRGPSAPAPGPARPPSGDPDGDGREPPPPSRPRPRPPGPSEEPPPPQPPPRVVRQVGEEAKPVVRPLPLVGPTGEQVIEDVVRAAEQLPGP